MQASKAKGNTYELSISCSCSSSSSSTTTTTTTSSSASAAAHTPLNPVYLSLTTHHSLLFNPLVFFLVALALLMRQILVPCQIPPSPPG